MLVDTKSLVDVLFYLAYNQMRLSPMIFKPANTSLYEFASCNKQPFGGVKLFITIGNYTAQTTVLFNFLKVDTPFVYNVIIGQPTLNALQAVAQKITGGSTYKQRFHQA